MSRLDFLLPVSRRAHRAALAEHERVLLILLDRIEALEAEPEPEPTPEVLARAGVLPEEA